MTPIIRTTLRRRSCDALRRTLLTAGAAAVVLLAPRGLVAQGNLSTQGLGYPPGQFSTRTYGAGGSTAEVDPNSPINPAALIDFGTTTLFFQIEPEFRAVSTGKTVERTTTARYPLLLAAFPLGVKWMVGVSSSTLLDDTWMTTSSVSQVIGADTVGGTMMNRVDGAINDVRAAIAYNPNRFLRLGMGLHAFTGSHRDSVERVFPDSSAFATFGEQRTVSFSGLGVSAGGEIVVPRTLIFAASYRYGGNLRAAAADTTVGRARVPDRFGASVAYIGIEGSTFAARTSYDKWTALGSLGGDQAVNAWDSSVGVDVAGPRFASRSVMLRAGGRWRTLPFTVLGNKVSEKSASVGAGALFGGGRASADVAAIRVFRDAGLATTERAWILSIGLTIRP